MPISLDCRTEAKYEQQGWCPWPLKSQRYESSTLDYPRYLFRTYRGILTRCYNKNDKQYKDYGDRGIRIHGEWYTSFDTFAEWIEDNLGPRPVGKTLDRIDNNKGYIPGNLKWSSRKEQSNNTREKSISKRSSTGVKGVTALKDRYQVRTFVEGVRIYLGTVDTVEEGKQLLKQFKEEQKKGG